jgi:hypothetical protein
MLLAEQSSDGENQETSSVIKKCRKDRMPEKRWSASAFLPVVSCFSPASAFWHQGSVRYRWSRTSPVLSSYASRSPPVWECGVVPRVQVKRRPSATGLLLRTHSAGPVSQTCLHRLLRRELTTRRNPLCRWFRFAQLAKGKKSRT